MVVFAGVCRIRKCSRTYLIGTAVQECVRLTLPIAEPPCLPVPAGAQTLTGGTQQFPPG